MKPDWDKLEKEYKSSDVVTIADVDCTAAGQPLCEKVGVKGYPTIKYWVNGKMNDYQQGRDFASLKNFVQSSFKAACDVSGKNCNEQEKRYIEKMENKTSTEIGEELAEKETQLKESKKEKSAIEKEMKDKLKVNKKKEVALTKAIGLLKQFQKKLGGDKKTKKKKKEEL